MDVGKSSLIRKREKGKGRIGLAAATATQARECKSSLAYKYVLPSSPLTYRHVTLPRCHDLSYALHSSLTLLSQTCKNRWVGGLTSDQIRLADRKI